MTIIAPDALVYAVPHDRLWQLPAPGSCHFRWVWFFMLPARLHPSGVGTTAMNVTRPSARRFHKPPPKFTARRGGNGAFARPGLRQRENRYRGVGLHVAGNITWSQRPSAVASRGSDREPAEAGAAPVRTGRGGT